MSMFGHSGDRAYERLLCENEFISEIQLEIECAMRARGVSQADLARSLNVSEARISQILSGNGANLQARTIAKMAHALSMRANVVFCDHASNWTLIESPPLPEGEDLLGGWSAFPVDVPAGWESQSFVEPCPNDNKAQASGREMVAA